MKWKKHTVKIALIAFSIISSFLATAPDNVFCAEQIEAKKLASIESVVPTGDGSATELVINLTFPATFTSYKTTSPLRLVIDFSQVTQGNISAPIIVNKGNFKTVTASRFDTDAGVLTRVEIELVSDSEALISALPANPGELKISFPALADSASSVVTKDLADKPQIIAEPLTAAQDPASAAGNETSSKTLTAILVNNNTITLALDGLISDFKTFRLNKPERFVVDLMNVKSGLSTRLLPLNASGVASARIGLYPDKVRVVLDAVNGSFPEATAVKADTGVIITLLVKPVDENANTKLTSTRVEKPLKEQITSNDKIEAPSVVQPEVKPVVKAVASPEVKPEAAEPASKITKKSFGASSIEMIDFQVVNGISRVSVKVSGDINADQPVKTPGYVTLTIKKTTLPKKLQRSLETRAFVSPVLRVTPLSIKTKKGTDTKIRIAMRIAAPFEYRQEGDMLYVDFKHPEGLSSDKLIIEATDQKYKLAPRKTAQTHDEDISSDLSPVLETTGKPLGTSRVYKGRKVTLEFADADVRKIFQLLSEVSNKNFVLSDDVTGNISMKLVNVPWDQALEIILDTKGLDKREDGNIILIKGKGKFGTQEAADAENKKNIEKNLALQPAKVFSVNYATLGDVVSQIEKLSSGPKGAATRLDSSVISDTRTNKIIVVDTLNRINQMQALLIEIDQPERQVMIEARIIEATSTFSRSLGVNWGVHFRDGAAALLGINSLDTAFGGLTSAPPTTGTATVPGGNMGISFGTLASNIKLDMRLSAAASAGMIKIISSPKVATLNNKTAKISQGQQIPYQNTTATTGAVTAFVAATLSLEVTPHINSNGTIVMKIEAKNDAPGTGSPPPINTKQATTELLLKDGETTVIGGIFVDSDQDADDWVPYLMDIPFLGNLFKTNTRTKTKTELLIFITPRILGSI